ncbi:hypothetical protein EV356DRAFT_509982 [Viridothelium virens]|uniref:Uncharacterized protein n=1 Tax=Viridothelium virens TaxID=1048519 RepID=A0A6A6GWD7_VIRVR|nr:hypothetical protein EV356DRAFT_509982 [Viridothelium virens]
MPPRHAHPAFAICLFATSDHTARNSSLASLEDTFSVRLLLDSLRIASRFQS